MPLPGLPGAEPTPARSRRSSVEQPVQSRWQRAVVQDRFRSWMMLLSTGIAAVAAIASACSAYFAYYIATH